MHHPTDRIAHTTAFVTPVVEHWLEREIAQWVHPMKDRSDDPSHHEQTLLPRSYISFLIRFGCLAHKMVAVCSHTHSHVALASVIGKTGWELHVHILHRYLFSRLSVAQWYIICLYGDALSIF